MATTEPDTLRDEGDPISGQVYDGFISYSHSADDLLAPRLQAGLQRFAKPWWKRRALRIFRDNASLAASPHLWESITDALDQAGWFIVLMSPRAGESEWVNLEVEYWLEHKDRDRIIPVLTEGDYRWSEGHIVSNAAPPALLDAFSDQPRWVDMRFARTDEQLDLRNASFRAAVADIAAPIRGIPKDELESEEVRQHRRTVRTAWGAGIAVLLFAVLASGAAVYAIGQQNRAEAAAQEAELATLISRSAALADEDPEASVLLALEAHRRYASPETEQAVMNALGSSLFANRISTFDPLAGVSGPCPFGTIHSNGLTEFAQVDGQLVSSDLSTGVVAEHGPSPGDCVDWMQDDALNRRAAEDRSGQRLWFGPAGGPWEVEREFDDPTFIVLSSFRPNHRLIALSETSTGPVVGLIDDRTGESVGPQHSGGRDFFAAGASPDGRFFVASFGTRNRAEGDGRIIVIDGETGDEVFLVDSPLPAESLTWDPSSGELVAGMLGGTVMSVDLTTGEVVSEVDTTTTGSFLDVGVRPDGLVVAVSNGQVELVDRHIGPTGTVVELRNVVEARVRPDGLILVITSDNRLELIDLEGNALVEQAWAFEPFSSVAFNAERAAALTGVSRTSEVVELSTGARTSTELRTPIGSPFVAAKIYAETDGLWAVDEDGVVARFEGDRMVEEIVLEGSALTGTRYLDLWALVHDGSDGEPAVTLLNLERGETGVLFSVPAPNVRTAHPTREGGVHVLDTDGTLRTYDPSAQLVGEIDTGWSDIFIITLDPSTGKVALGDHRGELGVLIVDPATGELDPLPDIEPVSNLGFARNGELLVITSFDGTVRLWDVDRAASGGIAWRGSGAVAGSPSWYDEATESIWVHSSGKLLRIPLNPVRWVERACEIVGRDFTQEEWDRFVPGDEPLQSACT